MKFCILYSEDVHLENNILLLLNNAFPIKDIGKMSTIEKMMTTQPISKEVYYIMTECTEAEYKWLLDHFKK